MEAERKDAVAKGKQIINKWTPKTHISVPLKRKRTESAQSGNDKNMTIRTRISVALATTQHQCPLSTLSHAAAVASIDLPNITYSPVQTVSACTSIE